MMRYLVLFAIAYFLIKTVKRLLSNFRIVDNDSNDIKGHHDDSNRRLHVDEADIEDAEFKDLD